MRYKEDFTQQEVLDLKAKVMDDYGHEPNVSTVSPTVGKELVKNAIKALVYCCTWYYYLRSDSLRMAHGYRGYCFVTT